MKVKDLIKDTVWSPGDRYNSDDAPKISVLLPTFRRGESGLFSRAVETILSQTIENIELIIIDDASSDGTFDQIVNFQKRDGRVSYLRHLKNVGLPAISEYEGYIRARADRIAFAFDDTEFKEDAFQKLLLESLKTPNSVVYGYVDWQCRDPKTDRISNNTIGSDSSRGLLRLANVIPNSGVLMPKSIIESVGLYDPHVVVARLCDWDLWRRVEERFEVRFVDVAVGVENGPMTNDSLGHTYPMDQWTVNEWMSLSRNERLKPQNFPEYDVLSPDISLSKCFHGFCGEMSEKHALSRGWEFQSTVIPNTFAGHVLIVAEYYDASVFLCFCQLPEIIRKNVRIVLSSRFGLEEMTRATCLVFIRRITSFKTWINAAGKLKIPIFYFLDDNLTLLEESGECSIQGEQFELSRFREKLKVFKGVLLSSSKLESYFRNNQLHHNIYRFPVAFSEQASLSLPGSEKKLKDEIVISHVGGIHRSGGFWNIILPSIIEAVSADLIVHLVVAKFEEQREDDFLSKLPTNIRVTFLPFNYDYLGAVRKFASYSPDIMVLAPSETINNDFKTLHPLLTARLLNAVPMLPNTQPYSQIADKGIALIVTEPFSQASWASIFRDVFTGKLELQEVKDRNVDFCSLEFSGITNVQVLLNLLRQNGGEVSWEEQVYRLNDLAAWNRATGSLSQNHESFKEQAYQLAEYRKLQKYSWRNRFSRKNIGLWDLVSIEFSEVKQDSEISGRRGPRASLELSDSLHEVPYLEYKTVLQRGILRAVVCALAADFIADGVVGVELVSPTGKIADCVSLSLKDIDLNKPVVFKLSNVVVENGEYWAIRFFAFHTLPVYIYEFTNRSFLRMKKSPATPFIQLVY